MTALATRDAMTPICAVCTPDNGWQPVPDSPGYEWRPTGHPVILFDVRGVERDLVRSNGYRYRCRGGRLLKPSRDRSGTRSYRLGVGRAGRHKWLTINAATLQRLLDAIHDTAADAAEAA